MSENTLYKQYQKVREQYSPQTLLAFQVEDNFEFYNDDAETLERDLGTELGLELGVRQVAKHHRVPMLQINESDIEQVFSRIVQLGHTLAVAEWIAPQSKQFEEDTDTTEDSTENTTEDSTENTTEDTSDLKYYTKKGKPRIRTNKPAEVYCSVCGKSLSSADSVERGMGIHCSRHAANLQGQSLIEHYASISLEQDPRKNPEWISFPHLRDIANAQGIYTWRLVQATGGDRATRRPLHPGLQVWYYKGHRFLKRQAAIDALQHIQKAQTKLQIQTTVKERENL